MTVPGSWKVQLDPPGIAVNRTMLDLNTGPMRVDVKGIDWGIGEITPYETTEQRYGSGVVSYRVPNRQVQIPLFLGADESGTEEATRGKLQEKVALLQREGGWLMRQRVGGIPMYADVVNASLTLPDVYGETGGIETGVLLNLECLPDFYGDMVTLDTITTSGETTAVLTSGGLTAVIAGDHPGRASISYADTSGNAQYGLLWGFRSRNYSSIATAALSYVCNTGMTTAAGATVGALSGSRSGSAITQTITTSWTDMAYLTGTHIGSYQVWARFYTATQNVQFRALWNIGDRLHGLITNTGTIITGPNGVFSAGFYLLNLGQVRIDPALIGNQQWALVLQGLSPSGSVSVSADMLYLQPLDEAAGELEGVDGLDPVAIASGKTLIRWDSVQRSISGGLVYVPVSAVVGDFPRIPPSGIENRAVQLFLKPSRGDLNDDQDGASSDGFTAVVSYRPCYMHRI